MVYNQTAKPLMRIIPFNHQGSVKKSSSIQLQNLYPLKKVSQIQGKQTSKYANLNLSVWPSFVKIQKRGYAFKCECWTAFSTPLQVSHVIKQPTLQRIKVL